MACYRLGTMLYPDIQKGKEAMNIVEFQQQVGGNVAYTKRLMIYTKGCGQMIMKPTFLVAGSVG